jgi:hypothetical protein
MSSQKYVPPALRNKKPAAEVFSENVPQEKPYEEQFPSLQKPVAPNASIKVVGDVKRANGTFAEKAREWNSYDSQRKREIEIAQREEEMLKNTINSRVIPQLKSSRKFVEVESDSEDEEQSFTRQPDNEDDNTNPWMHVKSKSRKSKNPKPQPSNSSEEESEKKPDSKPEENDSSVWDNDADQDDTCWK